MEQADEVLRVEFCNERGMHLRPCQYIAKRTVGMDVLIQVDKVGGGSYWWEPAPEAQIMWSLLDLGIGEGDEAVFAFVGPDAAAAKEEVKYILAQPIGVTPSKSLSQNHPPVGDERCG